MSINTTTPDNNSIVEMRKYLNIGNIGNIHLPEDSDLLADPPCIGDMERGSQHPWYCTHNFCHGASPPVTPFELSIAKHLQQTVQVYNALQAMLMLLNTVTVELQQSL